MDTKDYAQEIFEVFNYQSYANLMHCVGSQCNGRKMRFDKSDFVEVSLEEYSNGRFLWVDEEGYDNIDTVYDYKLECKFMEHSLFTKKKVVLKKQTGKYTIKNTQGDSKGDRIKNPADYYLFFQQNAMGILSGTEINNYTSGTGDKITAQIPLKALSLVFCPKDVELKNYSLLDYKKENRDLQRRIIRTFIN